MPTTSERARIINEIDDAMYWLVIFEEEESEAMDDLAELAAYLSASRCFQGNAVILSSYALTLVKILSETNSLEE
jgi:hypothetical protein